MTAKSIYTVKPLDNLQLERKLRKVTNKFKGVFDMDSLPSEQFEYPWTIVVNTLTDKDPTTGHWVVFLFDKFGRGHYFDSGGSPPPFQSWRNYLTDRSLDSVWTRSTIPVQDIATNTCGYLCIDYIVKRLKWVTPTDNDIAIRLDEMRAYMKYANL